MSETNLEYELRKLKDERKARLDDVGAEYYDRFSVHYRDNERYSWATETINRKFDEERDKLIDDALERDHGTFVYYLTKEQILEKYGDLITEDQLDKLIEEANQ